MKSFKHPKESLGDLEAEGAAALVAAASDIALIVDGEGVILDVAVPSVELSTELDSSEPWQGKSWSDVVTQETRPKVKLLMEKAAFKSPSRWQQLHHLSAKGQDIPVLYSVVRLQGQDRFVALGRDLRSIAALQQRLIEAQMSIERDYSRLRHAETRYRVMFQTSTEPVLIVDAATDRVIEANPAAARLFGDTDGRMIGRSFSAGLDADSKQALQTLATAVRAGLSVDDVRIRLAGTENDLLVSTNMFRQAAAALYIMRFTPVNGGLALPATSNTNAKLLEFLERSPDGHVVIDWSGHIVSANAAFLHLTQLINEDQARGELLERWFGRSGVDVSVLITNLRQHGTVTMFATMLRGEFGAATSVEVSGAALEEGHRPSFGLTIRNVERRISQNVATSEHTPRSVEQLKDLIGRVSLKDMVRESTDLIEKLCIEAALELTGDNRASAAEVLGLSRQSLYVKLRRYGIADEPEAARQS